jgi:hypothetical protein
MIRAGSSVICRVLNSETDLGITPEQISPEDNTLPELRGYQPRLIKRTLQFRAQVCSLSGEKHRRSFEDILCGSGMTPHNKISSLRLLPYVVKLCAD